MAQKVKIIYGDTAIMEWDPVQAGATIYMDGAPTQWQTADACHDCEAAVRLVAESAWGPMYEDAEEAEADDRSVGVDEITIWEDLSYEVLEDDE